MVEFLDGIKELKDTFRTVDVRIFCFKQDGVWKNIFTLVRLRHESLEELTALHNDLIVKIGALIETDEYRTGIFCYPIEKWDKIQLDFSNRFICLTDNFAVNYFEPISFNQKMFEPYNRDLDNVNKQWKGFNSNHQSSNITRPPYQDKLMDFVIANHFPSVNDYLSALFQFDPYDFQGQTWVQMYVPVFFKIKKVEFNHNSVKVGVIGYSQQHLELGVNFYQSKNFRNSELVEKITKPITLDSSTNLIEKEIILNLDVEKIGNRFSIMVTKNKKIMLDSKSNDIEDHWEGRTEFTNPLYFVFDKFVDFKSLEEMLFEFKAKDEKEPSTVFERGISWLLSLLRIPNIVLGGYEQIGNNYERISEDIIATDEDLVLLVNVTIALPKQSDFDQERYYREKFSKFVSNKNLKILSIYFTSKDPTASYESANQNGILLIGKTQIQSMLDYLKNGNIEKARKIIFRQDSF